MITINRHCLIFINGYDGRQNNNCEKDYSPPVKKLFHFSRYAFNTDIAEPVANHAAGLGVAVKR